MAIDRPVTSAHNGGVSRRHIIGGMVAGGVGVTTLALPASAAPGFNSYVGPTEPSGDFVAGENFLFNQISGSQVRVTWSRASGAEGPSQFSVTVEAYYIPGSASTPASNPYSLGTFSTVPQTFEPWNVGSVVFLTGEASMYPDVTSSSQIAGTRFRAVFTSIAQEGYPARTVSVPLDGYGIGDRWA